MKFRQIIWLGLCWLATTDLCLPAAYAEPVAAIVYGSYGSLAAAENARVTLQSRFDQELRVHAVDVNGRAYFRVTGPAEADIAQMRRQLQLVKKQQADAWLQISERPHATAPVRYPQSDEETNSLAVIKKTAVPVSASAPPGSVARAPVTIAPSSSGGVDATTQALFIPKFETIDIRIDGRLDDSVWDQVTAYDNMTIVEPDVLEAPIHKTQTKLFYTDEGLYVGTWAEQPVDKLIPRLSSRDRQINRDGTIFYLDTSGEGLYGFYFGVNLGGSLVDGTLLPERQLNALWDGPWDGSAVETDDGYSSEMFLPWSMMSMPDAGDIRNMRFSLSRRVAYLDEQWSWPALPQSKPKFMSGLQPIQLVDINPRRQLTFYPFSASSRDRVADENIYRVGADIFWRPSSNLQITATLNPDFGAVESDEIVVNFTGFETFFPEKRLFFLEGSEIFITSPRSAIRGSGRSTGARSVPNFFFLQPTTLLNTRRIGGTAIEPVIPDNVTIPDVQLGQPTALRGAIKVTGQKGHFRYGAMTAFEEDTRFHGSFKNDGSPARIDQDGRDFGIFRFLYENSDKGRRSIGWMSTLVSHPDLDAMTHGVDLHYRSQHSRIIADGQLLYSDVDDLEGYGGYFDINYVPRQGRLLRFSFDYLDDKLDISDLGFIRRNDAITYRISSNWQTSKLEHLRTRMDWLTFSHETNTDGRMVRSSIFYQNVITFNNRNQLTSTIIYRPEQWDDSTSEDNGVYRVSEGGIVELAYGTDTSRMLSVSIAANAISEVFGDWSYTTKGGITFKPNDRFSVDLDFNYRRTTDWLIHVDGRTLATYKATHWQPSIAMDLFITAKQQLRFSLQWVGIDADARDLWQVPLNDGDLVHFDPGIPLPAFDFTVSRITTQLRYRWEIAPLSDLFVVYTRGSNLPSQVEDGFSDLFQDALTNPVIDLFVVKLRYRFGI